MKKRHILAVGVSCGIVGSLLSTCSSTPPCEDDVAAFVMANAFVERQLRAPSTATFANLADDGVLIRPTTLSDGRCAFRVSTFVDAQNGFGAMIRERYVVTVAPIGEEATSYELIELQAP